MDCGTLTSRPLCLDHDAIPDGESQSLIICFLGAYKPIATPLPSPLKVQELTCGIELDEALQLHSRQCCCVDFTEPFSADLTARAAQRSQTDVKANLHFGGCIFQLFRKNPGFSTVLCYHLHCSLVRFIPQLFTEFGLCTRHSVLGALKSRN